MPSIAITGTPGVGKTTIVELFKQDNFDTFSILELAKQHDCLGEFDEVMQSREIEIHKLSELLDFSDAINTAIDGHLSHFINVQAIVILRCKPSILQDRLSQRGYDQAKITANVEWEMLAGTWSEVIEFELSQPILEIDMTEITPNEAYTAIIDWIKHDFMMTSNNQLVPRIDWLELN